MIKGNRLTVIWFGGKRIKMGRGITMQTWIPIKTKNEQQDRSSS